MFCHKSPPLLPRILQPAVLNGLLCIRLKSGQTPTLHTNDLN
ncbi:hypothetical protein SELSPUOL_01088 [Selenomonas sputigena ATCC 35185]|uniref:Uncharacterized protein n=1 Tax=Selenomonas sputigena (strain ATCC 35185 / DSM 20758 / CCUG 44933 / VPI D19B-28) TaxID=546271 RepID=C9LTS6_SELS3|nr:hypothetical protein SELSPUOL_01088 [Selenomonas sputigena ATCC 35185]